MKSKPNKLFLSLALLVSCLPVAITLADAPADIPRVEVSSVEELYAALAAYDLDDTAGIHIILQPGTYRLVPVFPREETRFSCEGPDSAVFVLVGLRITGARVILSGASSDSTVIETRASYGFYFDDCADCAITDITVTGGRASKIVRAGAVVARNSHAVVRNCVIRDNVKFRQSPVDHEMLGIDGVQGWENSVLRIENNEIMNNSGDGISLYENAEARIERNVIEGRSRIRSDGPPIVGEGLIALTPVTFADPGPPVRVAIRIDCDARAVVEKNLVRGFYAGVGVFSNAQAHIRVNFIEEMRTWGIALSDRGAGSVNAVLEENVVYDCGACGVGIQRKAAYGPDETAGYMSRNFIVHTAQNPEYDDDRYCFQCPLSLQAVPEGFRIEDNTFYDNRRVSEHAVSQDRTRDWFWRKRRGYVRKYRNTKIGVNGRHSFWDSSFLNRYGRF